MTQAAANPYLKTKVLTASPEELRLMLYDGAIKFCRQARHALTGPKKDYETSYNALTRAKNIILELSTSLNHKVDPDLCGKLAALYDYMFRRLIDANMERDETIIDEVIRLLEFERETWLMMLKKLQDMKASGVEEPSAAADANADHAPLPNPIASIGPHTASPYKKPTPSPTTSRFTAQA
jgi:flagellar protein FliS